jgi:hypothetical protein
LCSLFSDKPDSVGFGYEAIPDPALKENVKDLLQRPGFDPASGRMDEGFYILHTMHANLTKEQVDLNCQLRTAVKRDLEALFLYKTKVLYIHNARQPH